MIHIIYKLHMGQIWWMAYEFNCGVGFIVSSASFHPFLDETRESIERRVFTSVKAVTGSCSHQYMISRY